jgi:hypothetical protein
VQRELEPTATRISWWIQLLAGSIPSLAAVLVLFLMDEDSVAFKSMVAALIILGMIGYQLATRVSRRLSEIEVAMTGTKS